MNVNADDRGAQEAISDLIIFLRNLVRVVGFVLLTATASL